MVHVRAVQPSGTSLNRQKPDRCQQRFDVWDKVRRKLDDTLLCPHIHFCDDLTTLEPEKRPRKNHRRRLDKSISTLAPLVNVLASVTIVSAPRS